MKWGRASGILLHITSLPSRFGIGDLGPEAYRFADWLAEAGQHIWQVLPLGPVGYGESPYQLYSAFAGNPLLISLEDGGAAGCLGWQRAGPVVAVARRLRAIHGAQGRQRCTAMVGVEPEARSRS